MSGSTYYSKFVFTSTGLKGILEEFKMVAGQIEAQSVALGKMNFAGLNSSLPVLKNIDNTLLLMAEHMNLLSSAGAKVAAPFNQVSAGAAKAATSVKSVSTSMGQLATLSGTASSAAGKVTSSLSTLGAAGKTAFSGIVSGAERAVGALGAVSAAAMTATKAVTRMGALASLPMAGLKTMSSAVTGSMIAQSAGMLLNPMNSVPLAAGYGLYTYGNVQKAASEAAAKSWKPGMTQAQKDDIKKNVESISRQLAGQTVYSPTDYAKVAADYAGMGGDVSSQGGYNAKLAKLMGQYSQAINSPDIGTALEPLLSSNLVWYGGDTKKAGSYEAIKKSGDLRAMAVAQTKLQGKDLSDLLKDWEPVAKAYGQDQYQSTALVAGLAQLGLKPQQAGMAARRIALRGTPNLSSAQKMDAISLGLMDEDGNSVDESGKVIKANEVTKSLQQFGMNYGDINIKKQGGINEMLSNVDKKLKAANATEEQIQSFDKTVWGMQGITGSSMISQNPNFFKDLENLLRKSSEGEGAVVGMSNTQTDNAIDHLKMLGSAIKGSADSVGEYFAPSVQKLTDFLKDSAIPQLNALGSALAAGDWEGVADIAGNALDFIKEKFANSGEGITDFINGSLNGRDVFAGRLADWASGGGVGGLLGGLGDWAQGIWDNINWDKVDNITSNLSSAFNNAWDQSMTWLQGKLDGINWDSIGARLGAALEVGGAWLLKLADKIPWASITTAATKALTGIVLSINWGSALNGLAATAKTIATTIASSISSAVASSNIGASLQNAATGFRNTITGGINDAAFRVAGFAVKAGISPGTVAGITLESQKEAAGIVDSAKKVYNFDLESAAKKSAEDPNSLDSKLVKWFGALGSFNLEDAAKNPKQSPIDIEAVANAPVDYSLPTKDELKTRYPTFTTPQIDKFDQILRAIEKDPTDTGTYISEEKAKELGKAQNKPFETFVNQCVQAADSVENTLTSSGFEDYIGVAMTMDHAFNAISVNDQGFPGGFNYGNTLFTDSTPSKTPIPGKDYDEFEGTFAERNSGLLNPEEKEIWITKNTQTDPSIPTWTTGTEVADFTTEAMQKYYETAKQGFTDMYTYESVKPNQGYYFQNLPNGDIDRDRVISEKTAKEGLYLSSSDLKNYKFHEGTALAPFDAQAAMGQKGSSTVDVTKPDYVKSSNAESQSLKATGGGYEVPHADDDSSGDGESLSSSSSKPAEVFRGNDNYWTDPKNKFSFEGSALETFFKKPLETIGNYIKGGKLPTITDTSGVNREEPDGRKKAESTSKEQASATKEQTPVIKENSGAVTDLTSSNSDLSQMMGLLPSELQAAFESTTPDYDSMAKYLNKEFATSITAKDLQDQDAYDSKTHDDLIAPILAAMGISAAKLAEIKESSEDTEESTKKTAEHTSGLKGFDVEHLMNDVFGKPSTGTIGDDYAATTPAGTGTGTAPGTGAGSGSGGYGGAVRIGLDERGRETAVIGSVRQRSWEEEGKTWGATQFSEAARNAMSVGNSIMPVSADTTQAEASITAAKTIAAQPTKSNHWIYVDDSSVKNAIAFNKQPTWSQHTIYETTIKKALAGAGNYGDPIPSNLPKLKGTPNMNINNIPAFAEGGYTGAYSGPATVHPWEVVLNAAQQSNVAGVIGGGAAKTIQIFIDARGAVITDGSMDTLVAKIKSALQDESYR